jgi:hypothetical protein
LRKLVLAAVLAVAAAGATVPARSATTTRASFVSYRAPGNFGNGAGEPTLGVNPKTNNVLFQAGLETYRVNGFNGRGGATWKDVSPPLTSFASFDPILETDAVTGRTFVSQLSLACSFMSFTDNDGASWTPSSGCSPGSFFDHQSVGTGAFVKGGVLASAGAKRAVYYCSHDGATATCGTSVDGGTSFTPANIAYTINNPSACSTNFGHLKTAPDGTAYLPANLCEIPGLAVSEDNGLTWRFESPDGVPAFGRLPGHPSVGVGGDGTVYFAYGSMVGGGGGPPVVIVSRDKGRSFGTARTLGRELGIKNTKFVTTVAGDGDRAAVAFLGTKTGGNDQDEAFAGAWHLYVSMTYDRGRTWTTVNATPASPVQVGKICMSGTTCVGATRNLLDFNDLVIDKQGRVIAAIADGCPAARCSSSSREEKATIVRQQTGRGLLRAYDSVVR